MAHHNMLKLLPWVDLDLFFRQGQFCNLSFYIEKFDSDGFFGILKPLTWIYLTKGVNEGV